MSHLLDRLLFFKQPKESFSEGHGVKTFENRQWENAYRNRWSHDKVVRSTHGVNCTGSCSWKIYVKSGLVTWETQQKLICSKLKNAFVVGSKNKWKKPNSFRFVVCVRYVVANNRTLACY